MKQDTKKKTPGPKPDFLKIEGVNWKDAIKRSFQKQHPLGGFPKPERTKKQKG
jgi:hypothetical protein